MKKLPYETPEIDYALVEDDIITGDILDNSYIEDDSNDMGEIPLE